MTSQESLSCLDNPPIENSVQNDIELLRKEIRELKEEMDCVEPDEANDIRYQIENRQQKLRNLQKRQDLKPEKMAREDLINYLNNNVDLPHLPEIVRIKIEKFITFLKDACVPPWVLHRININTDKGVSVYGYYWNNNVCVKIRLSDHTGRWSGQNVYLKNPTDSTGISNYLKSLNR
jgi:FtsZ-binding cell division protein ZapB